MSPLATDAGTVPSLAETQNLSFIIHPQLNSVLIAHTFLVLLVPLIISLFYFSTPQSRQRPIFILNVAAIFLAFVVGVLIDVNSIHAIMEPLNPLPVDLGIAIGSLGVWQSILVDLILLVRLISVYPPRHTGLIRFSLLVTTPVLLKLARVVNIILFTAATAEVANGRNGLLMTFIIFETKPYLKIEWATQMIDNTYVSLAFLWRIRDRGNKRISTDSNGVTWAQRMRTLSRIALSNFIIPTTFSIAQFISVYQGISQQILEQVVLVNIMLATFGVAFATVWAGNISRRESHLMDSRRTGSQPMPVFAKDYTQGGITEDPDNVHVGWKTTQRC